MAPERLLLFAALLITLALAGYALYLWRQVWARRRAVQAAQDAQRERLHGDLRVLSGSLLDGQLPLIEGAIRIKVLLDHYDTGLSLDSRVQVFHLLFDATAQVPTHEQWKALPRSERRQHEAHFAQLAEQHEAAARDAARWLLDDGLNSTR